MDFLVAGSSLGRDSDEAEGYGLQAAPAAVPASEDRVRTMLPAFLPLEKVAGVPAGDSEPPMSDAEEVALYRDVMREEELRQKAEREKNLEEEKSEEPERAAWRPEKLPPAGLYRSGYLRFFLSLELLFRLAFFSTAIFLSFFILSKAIAYLEAPNMGFASFGAWFGGLFFLVLSGLSCLGCFFYAAALAMSILLDTGNGLKRIESWPRGFMFDWLLEVGYVAAALFWSALPSIPLGWLLENFGIPPVLVFAAVAAFVFPLALLAELDAGTFYFPGVAAVWLSPFRARRAWLDFYAITVPLMVIVAGAVAHAHREDLVWMLIASSILAAAAWLLYFRLLGRLAWYASGKAEIEEE
jgi:hypothetical protein